MKTVALIGNPNTGKTSLFNRLTASYAYVGNWSGVTVEKKVGVIKSAQVNKDQLIDFPGVYTLNPLSSEEKIVTKFLLNETYDQCLNVVDATMLEKNLHLTLQIIEFNKPMAMTLTMSDVARKQGIIIDTTKLSKKLQIPIFPVVARTGKGCEDVIANLLETNIASCYEVDYGGVVDKAVGDLKKICVNLDTHKLRSLAIQALDDNREVFKYLGKYGEKAELVNWLDYYQAQITTTYNVSPSEYFYNCRSYAIKELLSECVQVVAKKVRTFTDRIDAVLTHKLLGIPLFLLCMYLIFFLTFDWLGTPLSDLLAAFLDGPVNHVAEMVLIKLGASSFIMSLVLDGIIAGVGGILVFIPQIFILFFLTSLLEDSGYMARVSYVMDRSLEKVGLNGKSFISMIIGFGCNVPGIMVARSIDDRKERLLTMLLVPLMSCAARLPVYALFVGVFFSNHQASVIFSMYVLGVMLALILAKVFSSTIVKKNGSFFILELPPYRMPQLLSLWRSTWGKGKGFVKRAGTFIFAGTVIIWFLLNFGSDGFGGSVNNSYFAYLGRFIAPIFKPLGFGTWEVAVALLTGVLAKEVVVTTFNIIYHIQGNEGLVTIIQNQYTALSAYSFMVFSLIYMPCVATIATILKETFSKKWMFFAIFYSLTLGYVLSLLIYQVGRIFIG